MLEKEIQEIILRALDGNRAISFLVGAGISAESGIPTFRGKEGYWTIGSENHTPQSMGTRRMFTVNADQVWAWYLYRISRCEQAEPNEGHKALARIEGLLGARFSLISQNVDGLHFREESKIERLFLIHGDLRYMRCSEACTKELFLIPKQLINKKRDRQTPLLFEEKQLLVCPKCGEMTRPHVLWFDEYYNERYFYLDSTLRLAKSTGLMFVVGTSGATNLPRQLVENTLARNGVVIDVNPEDNAFSEQLSRLANGYRIKAKSSVALTAIEELMTDYLKKSS